MSAIIGRFRCRLCNFKTDCQNSMWRHKSSKHGNKVFECGICQWRTKCKEYIQRHLREKHLDNGDGKCNDFVLKFQCYVCRIFTDCQKSLSTHMSSTHDENKTKGKDTRTNHRQKLERHVRSSNHEKYLPHRITKDEVGKASERVKGTQRIEALRIDKEQEVNIREVDVVSEEYGNEANEVEYVPKISLLHHQNEVPESDLKQSIDSIKKEQPTEFTNADEQTNCHLQVTASSECLSEDEIFILDSDEDEENTESDSVLLTDVDDVFEEDITVKEEIHFDEDMLEDIVRASTDKDCVDDLRNNLPVPGISKETKLFEGSICIDGTNSEHANFDPTPDISRRKPEKHLKTSKAVRSRNDVPEFTCRICQFHTDHSASLLKHMLQNHGQETFRCLSCGCRNEQKKSWMEHLEAHGNILVSDTRPVEDILFQCDRCAYNKSNQISLEAQSQTLMSKKQSETVSLDQGLVDRILEKSLIVETEIDTTPGTAKNVVGNNLQLLIVAPNQNASTAVDYLTAFQLVLLPNTGLPTGASSNSIRKEMSTGVQGSNQVGHGRFIGRRNGVDGDLSRDGFCFVDTVQTSEGENLENQPLVNEVEVIVKEEIQIEENVGNSVALSKASFQLGDLPQVTSQVSPDISSIVTELTTKNCNADTTKNSYCLQSHYCHICRFQSKFKGKLVKHILKTHGKPTETFRCNVCGMASKFKGCFLKHISSHGNTDFQCNLCEINTKGKRKYKGVESFMKHLNIHVKDEVFRCHICQYCAGRKSGLRGHLLEQHRDVVGTFECASCGFLTVSKRQLLRHVRKYRHGLGDATRISHPEEGDETRRYQGVEIGAPEDDGRPEIGLDEDEVICISSDEDTETCVRIESPGGDVNISPRLNDENEFNSSRHIDEVENFRTPKMDSSFTVDETELPDQSFYDYSSSLIKTEENLAYLGKSLKKELSHVNQICDFKDKENWKHLVDLQRSILSVKKELTSEVSVANCEQTDEDDVYIESDLEEELLTGESNDMDTQQENQDICEGGFDKNPVSEEEIQIAESAISSPSRVSLKELSVVLTDISANSVKDTKCNPRTNKIKTKLRPKTKCDRCDFTTASGSDLLKHVTLEHSTKDHSFGQKFKCHICHIEVARKNALARHINERHSTETFRCEICGLTASSKRNLRQHKMTYKRKLEAHKKIKYKSLYCAECTYVTSFKRLLKRHMISRHRNHTKEQSNGESVVTAKETDTLSKNANGGSVRNTAGKRSRLHVEEKSVAKRNLKESNGLIEDDIFLDSHTDQSGDESIEHYFSLINQVSKELTLDKFGNAGSDHVEAAREDHNKQPVGSESVKELQAQSKATKGRSSQTVQTGKNGIFKCDICGKIIRFKSNFNRHLEKKHHTKANLSEISSGECPKQQESKEIGDQVESVICHICQFSTKYKTSLVKHIRQKHGRRNQTKSSEQQNRDGTPFMCNICGHRTKFKYNYSRHMRRHHGIDISKPEKCGNTLKGFSCHLCQFKSRYRISLAKHIRINHTEKDQTTPSLSVTHTKVKENEGNKPFVCNICGHRTRFVFNYSRHMKVRHGIHVKKSEKRGNAMKGFSCHTCQFKTRYRSSIVKHVKIYHTKKDQTTPSSSVTPKKIKEDDSDKPFICHICGHRTRFLFNYSRHMKVRHGIDIKKSEKHGNTVKGFSCHTCQFKTRYRSSIVNHVRTYHTKKDQTTPSLSGTCTKVKEDESNKPFVCNICGHGTKFKFNYTRHMRRHHGIDINKPEKCGNTVKGFSCHLCQFKTRYRISLAKHVRINHTKNDQTTPSSSATPKKIKEDQGNKPFICDICGHRTRFLFNYSRHMRVRHGLDIKKSDKYGNTVKGFSCHICQFRARYKISLVKHMKLNHSKKDDNYKQFVCSICGHETKFKFNYSRHMRVHHGIDIKQSEKHSNAVNCRMKVDHGTDVRKSKERGAKWLVRIFNCDVCPFQTRYIVCMRRHLVRIHGEQCAERFSVEMQELKQKGNAKPFKCHVCGLIFRLKRNYWSHIKGSKHNIATLDRNVSSGTREVIQSLNANGSDGDENQEPEDVESGTRMLECNVCKAEIRGKDAFLDHLCDHTKKGPFRCPICERQVKCVNTLRKHLRLTHGTKRFQCNLCGLVTPYKPSLSRHIEKYKDNLEAHMKLVTKNFSCELCGYRTNRLSMLTKHKKLVHMRETEVSTREGAETARRLSNRERSEARMGGARSHINQ